MEDQRYMLACAEENYIAYMEKRNAQIEIALEDAYEDALELLGAAELTEILTKIVERRKRK